MENTKLRASQKYKKRSTFDSIWRQLRKNKGAIVGMILLGRQFQLFAILF